jgi:hypothetical protein
MAEKVVIDLEVDVQKSERTLGQLEDRAEALNEELRKVPLGSKAFNELKQELVGVNKEIKNTELAMESLDNEQVASELGSVAGAVGDLTAAFILLGGDDDSALAETAANIEKALGVTMAFKGTIEGVISFQKLWNNTLKQTSVVQGAIATGTKIYAAAQGVLNFVIGAGSTALKLFRLALISTGIGAIVVGIGMLIANFGKVKEVIMDVINFAIEPFRKALQFLGLIESDQEKARRERAEAEKKRISEERKLRSERADELKKQIEQEEKLRDRLITKYDDEIRIAKSLGKNTIEIERQKLKALIESFKLQKQLFDEQFELRQQNIKSRQEEFEAQLKENNFFTSKIAEVGLQRAKETNEQLLEQKQENNDKLKDAEIDLLVFENEIATERRKERKKQDEKDIEDAKKKAEQLLKIERERLQNIQDLENQLYATIEELDEEARQRNLTDQQKEIEAVQEKYFSLINDTRLGEEEILRLKQYAKDEEAAINERFRLEQEAADKESRQEQLQGELDLQNAKLDLASQGIDGIMALTNAFAKDNEKSQRRAFEINKRLQIAQAIISTYQGANNIFASAAANPKSVLFPAQPFIAAGLAIVSGLANVATISRQQFQGGSAGGGGGTTTAPNFGAGETAPTIAPVTNTSTLIPQEPQQVFVTETDITNTQNQVAVIETQATIK